MAEQIRVGDIVNVTIKGVRNVGHPSARLIRIADENGDTFDMPPQAAVERVASAHWPPRLGDVWQSADEGAAPLFAVTDTRGCVDIEDGEVFLVNVAGTFMNPATVLSHGPLELLYRTPGQAAVDVQVARVREIADELHEQAPTNPDPSYCREHCPGCAVNRALDVEGGNPAGQVEAVRDAAADLHVEFFSPAAHGHEQGGGCRDNCPGCRIESALDAENGADRG